MDKTQISVLPEGVFTGLSILEALHLCTATIYFGSYSRGGVRGSLQFAEAVPGLQPDLGSSREGVFAGLSILQELSPSNNQISILPDGVFTGLTELRTLRLYCNQISILSEGVFAGLTELRTMYLSSNPKLSCVPPTNRPRQ